MWYVSMTLLVQKLKADLQYGKHGDPDLSHLQSPKLLKEYRLFYKHYDSSIQWHMHVWVMSLPPVFMIASSLFAL